MIRLRNNWQGSPLFDSLFILFPSFIAVLFVVFRGSENLTSLPLWMWVALVMGIDVAHVYSTLFKTYFHSKEFEDRKNLYVMAPILVWIIGIFFYSIGAGVFWTLLAYLAVFHFIRQQYGLLRLYSHETEKKWKMLDNAVIYVATLYPIIYWHAHPRDFNWFIEGDFFTGLPPVVEKIAFVFYLLIIGIYVTKEIVSVFKIKEFNLGKNLIVSGTILSWYIGIVHYNGDIAFTVTNVIAHGIPYMALIWIWGRKNVAKHINRSYGVVAFLGVILLLAFIEEGLWAGLVWREHLSVFNVFSHFPQITDKATLSWLVPLLTLPQATHYVLDGFIWKSKASH